MTLTVLKSGFLTLSSDTFTTEDTVTVHTDVFEVQMSHVRVIHSGQINSRIFEVEKAALLEGDGQGYGTVQGNGVCCR